MGPLMQIIGPILGNETHYAATELASLLSVIELRNPNYQFLLLFLILSSLSLLRSKSLLSSFFSSLLVSLGSLPQLLSFFLFSFSFSSFSLCFLLLPFLFSLFLFRVFFFSTSIFLFFPRSV